MLPIFDEYKHATDMNNGTASDRDREEKRVYSFRDLVIYAKWLRWSLWSSEINEEEKIITKIIKTPILQVEV